MTAHDEYVRIVGRQERSIERKKAEETVRETLRTLTGSWEGWPASEADWAYLRTHARTLHHACELRAGLLVIEES